MNNEAKRIVDNRFVSIHYTLKDAQGNILDESSADSPLGFVVGHKRIIPGLEAALKGKTEGETLQIVVPAGEGYGDVNEELFQEIPRENFPDAETVTKGQQFQANTPHGPMRFLIHDVTEETVTVNLNHPMAGQDLHFDVEVAEVREATEEELNPPHHHHCKDGSHGCCGG
jgi:FKBP-type peptidyl-prolyl cis-trans isomerase SlyD